MHTEDPFKKYARLRDALKSMSDTEIKCLRNHKLGCEDSAKTPLKVTFQLKDLSDTFYLELKEIDAIGDKFNFLRSHKDLKIHCRIGNNGSFRDQVALNSALRDGQRRFKSFSVSPRRGFVLATFTVDLAG